MSMVLVQVLQLQEFNLEILYLLLEHQILLLLEIQLDLLWEAMEVETLALLPIGVMRFLQEHLLLSVV